MELNDPRAKFIHLAWKKLWKRVDVQGEYGEDGQFRVWLWRTTNHFFSERLVWPDACVQKCCDRLGIECQPPLDCEQSFSEDEIICSRSETQMGF